MKSRECIFCRTTAEPNEPSCATAEEALKSTVNRPSGCPWLDHEARQLLQRNITRIDLPGGIYIARDGGFWRLHSVDDFGTLGSLTDAEVEQYRKMAAMLAQSVASGGGDLTTGGSRVPE